MFLLAFGVFSAAAQETDKGSDTQKAKVIEDRTSPVVTQKSEPLKILEKPRGILKGEYGNVCIQGTVRVRVEFLASGEIGKIAPIKSLPYGLTESAMEAAKRIKFVPAKKDGIPLAVSKVVEYSFGLYFDKVDFAFVKEKQNKAQTTDEKAEAIIQKAIQKLGGDRYLQVKTIVGRGNFNQFAENGAASFSSFVDTIVFPDKERTEFKSSSLKTIQTNVGDAGWYYDSTNKSISDQTPEQIAAFKQSIRTSLDNLLRGNWRKENAKLEYIGRREASLGKRNEAIKLIYADNFAVEFEFSAQDGTPAKILYKRKNADGEETKEETRFAQFIEVNGVFAPFILDFYRNGKLSGRANYSTIEFNTPVPDSFFTKPADVKKIK
ncbi:MAG TPA: energy transducer TonB [Pyrinomonadaceae bacterium]